MLLDPFLSFFLKMTFFSLYPVPQQSLVPNGIRCPACYNENDMSCDPVLLTCTGTETKCVTVTGSGMDTARHLGVHLHKR